MNLEPKIEPGSPSSNHVILDRDEYDDIGAYPMETLDLEGMSIPDLVQVLLGSLQMETYERVEGVLVRRDLGLRDQIQLLGQNVEMERQQLQMEKVLRLKAEEELKKREELCQKMKKVQEIHNALLKEAKMAEKTHNKLKQESQETIDYLRKRNVKLKCEVDKLNEKRVEEGHELEVLTKKNDELECEVNKLKEERVEDGRELGVQIKMIGEMENKVSELTKLKEKWEEDCNAWAGIEIKNGELNETVNKNLVTIRELRNENSKLANDKRNVDILLESWITKFRVLHEKVLRLEDDSKLLMSLNVSGGGNNEGDPPVDFMAADSEEKDKEKEASSESEVKDASSAVGHVKVSTPVAVPSASQVDPVAIPYVPDSTNGNKRKSKSLHVKDVKKAKVRSSHVKDVTKAKVRSSDRLRKLKTKMIDGPGKDASSPFVIEDSDECYGIDESDGWY